MVTYREPATVEPKPIDTLYELSVSTERGGGVVVGLWVVAIVGIGIIAKAPELFRHHLWTLPVGIGLFAAVVIVMHFVRSRTLRLVQQGTIRRLVVDREHVELTFPLWLHGDHTRNAVGTAVRHDLDLQCIDAAGRAVFFRETRGLGQRGPSVWLSNGLDPKYGGPRFRVGGTVALTELGRRIDAINATIATENSGLDPIVRA